jgi:hypothetical protein
MLVDDRTRIKSSVNTYTINHPEINVPPYPLYTPSQAKSLSIDNPALKQTLDWVWGFLAKPHPELGRPGAVCPYVEQSMNLNKTWLTIVDSPVLSQEEIEDIVMKYRDVFLDLEPTRGRETINKAMMMIFPHVPMEKAPELIDAVQANLKPRYTKMGLMLGEFHQYNQTPGLRNEHFFPLRSPIPMLVIRYMVESDLPFLTRQIDSPGRRVLFLKAYLRRLAGDLSEKQMDQMIEALVMAMIEDRNIHNLLVEAGCPEESASPPCL